MTRRVSLILAAVVALSACGEERIEVHQGNNSDYHHAELLTAVDKFVAAGRTPAAYAELSQTVFALRAGMDRSVAKEAELKLMVLALTPVQSVQAKPMAEQIDTLALSRM